MKGTITISRPSYGDGRQKISIQVKDVLSKTRFLEIEIDYDKFAQLITGLSELDCDLTVKGLQNVGKTLETKPFSFPFPDRNYTNGREEAAKEAERLCPEGWIVDPYFCSKDSFQGYGKECTAHTRIKRWV